MKLLRGAWTEGLSAIHPVVRRPSRPKLRQESSAPSSHTRRAEIEAFLNHRNQPWREDSTNADTAYTRNRIRHELLPQLRAYNPSSTRPSPTSPNSPAKKSPAGRPN